MTNKLYPLLLFLFFISFAAKAQTESEPNNSFATASNLGHNVPITGTINCAGDGDDYFKIVLPTDGTVRVYFDVTNTGSGTGYVYFHSYDKIQNGLLTGHAIGNNFSIAPGATITDSVNIFCRAADTMYLRMNQGVQCFNYTLRYKMINNGVPNDIEPNDDFAQSINMNAGDTAKGHISYTKNGTNDASDFYKTLLPEDGRVRVYLEATNSGSNSGYVYFYAYDKGQNGLVNGYPFGNNFSIASGTTVIDSVDIFCRAADSMYFRVLQGSQCFSYKLRYKMITDNVPVVSDTGNNELFATANYMNFGDTVRGRINYNRAGFTDVNDYYKTSVPLDGTVRIYLQATNTGNTNGYVSFYSYDKSQGQLSHNYIGNSTSVPPGATVYDTVKLYCRAADSMYFLFYQGSQCFSYTLQYDVVSYNANATDTGDNEIFAAANYTSLGDTVKGRINYIRAGFTDGNDYYKTSVPLDGTVHIYLEATNTGNSNGHVSFYTYDKNQGQLSHNYIGNSTSVPLGVTVYDTVKLYCRAADSMYFLFYQGAQCFSYKMQYALVGNNVNVSDTGNNENFATANNINLGDTVKGRINHLRSGFADGHDYYKTLLPIDGTVRVYLEATNTGNANGYVSFYAYDKTPSQISNIYIGNNTSVPPGTTVYDSVDINCRLADSVYFLIYQGVQCFDYKMSYKMLGVVNLVDQEPNNTIASANYIGMGNMASGNINYQKPGFNDNNDYYKTKLVSDGTVRVYVQATNTGTSSGYLYLYAYDANQAPVLNAYFIDNSTSLAPGVTVYDTVDIECRAADTMYFLIAGGAQCFNYKLHYEVSLTNDTTLFVCPGFTTDISQLYNTKPFSSVTYTNMGGGGMPPLTAVPNGVYRLTVQNGSQLCTRDTAIITVGLHPKPNIGNDTLANVCPGFTTNLTTYKNTTGLTTQWMGTSTPTTAGPGTYTLIVTNPQGCMDTAVITIGLHPKPNIGNDTLATVCPGFTTNITTYKNTTGLTTQWLGTSTPTTAGPGTYTLIVTNPQGCMDTAVITIGLNPKPNIGNDTLANVCPGFTTNLTTYKNTTGLTTQWMGTSTPTSVGPGTYTLIVTNTQGCMDTAVITIGLNAKPNIGNDSSANVCSGFTTNLITYKNTSGLTTQWMGTSTPTTAGPGTYTLIVTNPQGCMDTAIITIGLNPKPSIGNDTSANVCPGFTTNLTAFKNTTGLTTQWLGTSTPTTAGPGTYSLIVTNPQGCMDTAVITINAHPKPNIGNDTSANVCSGFTTNLTTYKNTTGLTTQWLGTSTPTSVGPGTYTLVVSNTQGCMDTAVITIGTHPQPNLGNDTTLYAWIGETVNFVNIKDTTGFAANGWTATWTSNINGTSGNTTVVMTETDTVRANLAVITQNGCKDTAFITIYPARDILPPTGLTSLSANVQVTDPNTGWTHYYFNNNTPGNKADDILVLSLKKNGNNIGTVGTENFMVRNVATQNAGSNSGIQITNPLMSNPSNYFVMHRYWQVTVTNQPTSDVGVRFYYNTQDFNDANGSFGNSRAMLQMVFYHLKDGNPDPTSNWAGATMQPVSIVNGATATNTTWVYTSMTNNNHRAEFTVNSFSGGGGGLTGNNGPLPVELISFTAAAKNQDAVLNWQTASEKGLLHYELERSTDGSNFSSISKVNAKSATANEYSYTDVGAASVNRVLYYRLKMHYANGDKDHSHIARIVFEGKTHVVTLSPNPAKDRITISGVADFKQYKVIDISGRLVLTKTISMDEEEVDISNLAAGTYTIVLSNNTEQFSMKFVKE